MGWLWIPSNCPPNNWIVRETDEQLMQRVIAISTFPEVLDQRLWNGKEMKPEVRTKSLQIVNNLVATMRLSADPNDGLSRSNITVGSVELFGSNASYEYDDAADYGVHVFMQNADTNKISLNDLENYLRIFNSFVELSQEGKILFNGIIVEITFHAEPRGDSYKPKPGIGQFSITDNKWIVEPIAQPNNFDRDQMLKDARGFVDKWNTLVCQYFSDPLNFDCGLFDDFDDEMGDYRAKAFDAGLGSRSTGNLTYRMLRRLSVNIPDGVDLLEELCEYRKLSVYGATPQVEVAPASQVVFENGTAQFSVQAFGANPITYQWVHNGIDIPGATSSTLLVNKISSKEEGLYAVRLTSNGMSTTSNPARLTLIPGRMTTLASNRTNDPSKNGFNLEVVAPLGQPFVVEGSTDLIHWKPLANLLGTGVTVPMRVRNGVNDPQSTFRINLP